MAGTSWRGALGWGALAAVAYQYPLLLVDRDLRRPGVAVRPARGGRSRSRSRSRSCRCSPGCPGPRCGWPACGWRGRRSSSGCPSAGSRGRSSRSGRPAGRTRSSPRWAGRRWSASRWSCRAPGSGGWCGRRADSRRRPAALAGALVAVLVGPVVGLLVPAHPAVAAGGPGDHRRGGAGQRAAGGPRLREPAPRRARQPRARDRALAAGVAAGRTPRPDLVIWPENSSDIDPFANADARAEIQAVTDEVGVPVVVGAVLRGARTADGTAGAGAAQRRGRLDPAGRAHRPVRQAPPAALRRVHPDPRVRVGCSPATSRGWSTSSPAPATRSSTAGPARLGVATCYEVVFDGDVADAVDAGADLLDGPDEQRHVRLHGHDLPAAGHEPAAGGGARPRRGDRRDERTERGHRPRRHGASTGPGRSTPPGCSSTGCRCAPRRRSRPVWGRARSGCSRRWGSRR